MSSILSPEINEVMEAVPDRPAVSIIMPFEPKMGLRSELSQYLAKITAQVRNELFGHYPEETSERILEKLNKLIGALNFNTHKKSLAIYLSPSFEKIIYLDIPVLEKVMINESFEIRDLVFNRKQTPQFLVLVLSLKIAKLYMANSGSLVKIASNKSESAFAYLRGQPEKTTAFPEMPGAARTVVQNFMRHVDEVLTILLKVYRLPLFVTGTGPLISHFKNNSGHRESVIEFIKGNYEQASLSELKELLDPYFSNWEPIRQKYALLRLKSAEQKKKLAKGIADVWLEAAKNKSELLVVEKDYTYPGMDQEPYESINPDDNRFQKFFASRDPVDEIIEKVLQTGGDVEFVREGALKDYGRIALILQY